MRIYEFHFFDAADRRPVLDFFDGDDDVTAIKAARAQLLRHASCQGVEVHEAARLVARVDRDCTVPYRRR